MRRRTSSIRRRAIGCALWYGMLPWWLYERTCHYAGITYWAHAKLNLRYALRWLTYKESAEDVAFEKRTNSPADPGSPVRTGGEG